ncbi:enolase C-terminal domain-like protein [Streptomyces sp. NPDC004752]
MRITHVECFQILVPAVSPPFSWRRGLLGSPPDSTVGVLRVGTDAGVEGVAITGRPGSGVVLQDLVDRLLRDLLVGKDPLQRELLWHEIWELDRIEELPLPLLGVVDTALWDLAGRFSQLPTWQVIGGFRESIPAYASTSTFGSVSEYLDVATQSLELGFTAIKLHAWGDAQADAELCQKLRSHVGDSVPLMYDGSAGFDLPDAVHLGRVLADAGYLWYEEPMREFSVSAYKQLARSVGVPLLVAETSDGAHMNSADFIVAGSATFGVRTSAELRGGFTGAMRTAHLADAFRVRAEVHGGGMASRHLCMAIPNTTYFESLVTSLEVVRPPEVDSEGMVHAPRSVGIALPRGLDYPSELQPYVDER